MAPHQSIPVLLLRLGKAIHDHAAMAGFEQPTAKQRELVTQCESELAAAIKRSRDWCTKTMFRGPIPRVPDPLAMRILGMVAYVEMCSPAGGSSVSTVATAAAIDRDVETIMAARQVCSQLAVLRHLELKDDSMLNPQLSMSRDFAAFLTDSRWPLAATTPAGIAQIRRRKPEAGSTGISWTARSLCSEITKHVVGIDRHVQIFSSRLTMHMRRAEMIGAGNDPGTPNEVILLIGPSGSGKTFLVETAGRLCQLPFAAFPSSELSETGWVGCSVDQPVLNLVLAAGSVQAARRGMLFLDEVDSKRAQPGYHRDISGTGVQKALLRLIEGMQQFPIGGRRGSADAHAQANFDSRGTFFALAGVFGDLQDILKKQSARGVEIGFGYSNRDRHVRQDIHAALEQYGLIPELTNRLTSILVMPEPTISQLVQIAGGPHGVVAAYNKLLAPSGVSVLIEDAAIHLMATYALETRTLSRGLKAVASALVQDVVFNETRGVVRITREQVIDAIDGLDKISLDRPRPTPITTPHVPQQTAPAV